MCLCDGSIDFLLLLFVFILLTVYSVFFFFELGIYTPDFINEIKSYKVQNRKVKEHKVNIRPSD